MRQNNLPHLRRLKQSQVHKSRARSNLIKRSWSEVDTLYNVIAESIVRVGSEVNTAISLINATDKKDNPEVVTAVRGLTSDLEAFTSDLIKIKGRHSNRSGTITEEDDLALSISVFEDYTVLSERFNAIIFNPMLTITEALGEVMSRQKIEDAEYREIPVDTDDAQPREVSVDTNINNTTEA